MTSWPCHRSRYVECLQEISCCFKQWDEAIISTIYASVAPANMIEACFVHPPGFIPGNLSAKIPKLTTSWCSISQTVWTNALVNHGGFSLWAAINWSHSSWRIPAVWYRVTWQWLTTEWIYSHRTAWCFLFVLLPVLRTIFKCAPWVIFLVAVLTASQWTNRCLHSCCVHISDALDEEPANRLDLDPLYPGWGGCVSIICWSWIGEEDDNDMKWEVLRII